MKIVAILCVLVAVARAGVVTFTNTSAEFMRVTFEDGAYVGSVVCAPKSHVVSSVAIAAETWSGSVESSADGVTFAPVTGGSVSGTTEFLSDAQLSFLWDGSVLSLRLWRQGHDFYFDGLLLGLGSCLGLFGVWLTATAIRKGTKLGSDGQV